MVARFAFLLGIALCASCAQARTPATPTSDTGELRGAPWRIDVPGNWNNEVVMLAHGFEPVGTPREREWPANGATHALLAAGYAVAQSGYSGQGWAVADGVADTERLRQLFLSRYPQTTRAWVFGFSMGGAVAIATLEQQPEHYAGGVSLCGANLPGDAIAGEVLTTLVAFDYFFPAARGLPASGLASRASAALSQGGLYEGIAAALQTRPDVAATLARRLEVPLDNLPDTISLHALVFHDMVKRYGGVPVGNQQVVYAGFGDDAAFNAGVRRQPADAAAQAAIARELPLTGALRRPLVIQFNKDDPTIPPRMRPTYPRLAAQAGATPAPERLPDAGEGHCGFSDEQVVAALKALTD